MRKGIAAFSVFAGQNPVLTKLPVAAGGCYGGPVRATGDRRRPTPHFEVIPVAAVLKIPGLKRAERALQPARLSPPRPDKPTGTRRKRR